MDVTLIRIYTAFLPRIRGCMMTLTRCRLDSLLSEIKIKRPARTFPENNDWEDIARAQYQFTLYAFALNTRLPCTLRMSIVLILNEFTSLPQNVMFTVTKTIS